MCILSAGTSLGEYVIKNDKIYCYLPNATPEATYYLNKMANLLYKKTEDKRLFGILLSSNIKKLIYTDVLRESYKQWSLNLEKVLSEIKDI